MEKLNIYQKLNKIVEELGFVKKNLNVQLPNGKYKAVAETDVLEAVKPLEVKYGIYSYPFSRQIIVDKETTTKGGTVNQFIRVEVGYRFVNVENPTEYIDMTTYGDGVDSGDKAPGKAMTYADKYALLKAYKISTGDDPDAIGSEEQQTIKPIKPQPPKIVTPVTITPTITPTQVVLIEKALNGDAEKEKTILDFYKVKGIEDLTIQQATQVLGRLNKNAN